MRVHHLEITAFGPFSGHESVDFDELNDAGLFLLCGATGSGKTSVLDAICFGLYGEVPGDRNGAKRLRSDHAAPGVAPAVLLEVSINARRFRIRRSPAWRRPKRRGTGTTIEQARVSLEEMVEGRWVHHSTRLDETAHLLSDLLGMNVSQFCQVAMLPQGRFQSFMRATSHERHNVLQQLFRTSRFEDIERWLVGHRQCLKAADRAHHESVVSVVSRISEAALSDVPASWDLHELTVPAAEGEVATWATGLLESSRAALTVLETELCGWNDQVAVTRDLLTRGNHVLELRARHAEALRIERSLEESDDQTQDAIGAIDAARRAAAISPLLKVAENAGTAAEVARRNVDNALSDAAQRLGTAADDLTREDLASAERDAREAAAIARALLPRESALRSARLTVESTDAALAELEREAARLAARCDSIPAELVRLRKLLAEQTALTAGLGAVDETESRLTAQLTAAETVVGLRGHLESARQQELASAHVARERGERIHDVREARINGMAAELALVLASGNSCPVCGSAEHPCVAEAVEGAPTRTDEETARSEYEDAEFDRQANKEAVKALEQNLALAEQCAQGKSVDALREEISTTRRQRVTSQGAATEKAQIETRIASVDEEQAGVTHCRRDVGAEIARLNQQRDHARDVVDTTSVELAALFEDGELADSVQRLVDARSSAGQAFAEAREALADRDAAIAKAREARENALQSTREHGFDTCAVALSAVLERTEVEALEDLLRDRDTLRAEMASVLSDHEVRSAVETTAPDVAVLKAAVGCAEGSSAACGAESRVVANRVDRLASLDTELGVELDAWAPTRSAYSVARGVSILVEGKGSDNSAQIRLSGYVLAARLKQVVAAGNERLSAMSDQRYTLQHSAVRGVGELRGGLSLLIRDEWTGESRDPATLSGGETFVASLALALGLADVVTQEAGGSNVDTLFIDEGFGSLDPDTLDGVMDTLDSLRDGGRVVGVVSHVPEMRSRVTAQLRIRKERSGSRVVSTRTPV